MKSILIRFTKKEFIKTYRKNQLYMSSINKFWNIKNQEARKNGQLDIFEGLAYTSPKDKSPIKFGEMQKILFYDNRYRIDAYKYCNIQCFYRLDIDEEKHLIRVPQQDMYDLGNRVIIVKDEENFVKNIIKAVKKVDGECIIGDVKYHGIKDRSKGNNTMRHSATLIIEDPDPSKNFFVNLNHLKLINDLECYGCLDKYNKFEYQHEWRICYLPKQLDTNDIKLKVNGLFNLIEVVPAIAFERYLLDKYPGYKLAHFKSNRENRDDTISYNDFKSLVESIDGNCTMLIDIG